MKNIALILLILFPATAVAQTVPCTTQVYGEFDKELNWHCPIPNEDTMVPKLDLSNDSVALTKGAAAPFTGLLLDQNRVLMLGLRITGLRRLQWIELRTARSQQKIEVARATEVAKQDALAAEAQNTALVARNAQLSRELQTSQAWYRSWTFGFVLGTIITTAAAVSLAIAVK
jgi:hypothetical protein